MYTPSKIKISMLCALALCGQVRRDDLAIFARTADAGVRTIRELEDKGLIEDKTVEVTVRIDGRNRRGCAMSAASQMQGFCFCLRMAHHSFRGWQACRKKSLGRSI